MSEKLALLSAQDSDCFLTSAMAEKVQRSHPKILIILAELIQFNQNFASKPYSQIIIQLSDISLISECCVSAAKYNSSLKLKIIAQEQLTLIRSINDENRRS